MRISDWSSDVCSSDLFRISKHKQSVMLALWVVLVFTDHLITFLHPLLVRCQLFHLVHELLYGVRVIARYAAIAYGCCLLCIVVSPFFQIKEIGRAHV